ncbi:MAG: WD40/YVTN/BNR-like repeat-containing protein [Acidobacteriota bacterium]
MNICIKKCLLPLILSLTIFLSLNCGKDPVSPPPNEKGSDTTSHAVVWQIDTIGNWMSSLHDVWGTDINNLYAVGFVYLPGHLLGSNILHWDGVKWTPLDYLEGDLASIYGFSDSDIWIAGDWQVDNNLYCLISHWDGKAWKTWKMQEYPNIYCIWGTSSKNMYAVGAEGTMLHYDGYSWQKVQLPGVREYLRRIYGVSENEIYAVGNTFDDYTGVVLKSDGNSWKKLIEAKFNINDPHKSPEGNLSALWASKSNRFFVDLFVGHDTTWTSFGWPNDNTIIDAIRGSAENNIFAVGSFGLIMHYNGKSWNRYPFYHKPYGGRIANVWVKDKAVVAVGYTDDSRAIVYRGIQQ